MSNINLTVLRTICGRLSGLSVPDSLDPWPSLSSWKLGFLSASHLTNIEFIYIYFISQKSTSSQELYFEPENFDVDNSQLWLNK